MSEPLPLMYDELADWFHLLTAPDEYAEEAAEVVRILEAHMKPPLGSMLELGSGGGNLASHLSGQLRMTLTDLSPAMLEVSRSINPRAEHVVGDMRDLRLGRAFDAVIAHDAIGYMTTLTDLRAALETAAVHLRPGGAAVFLPDWTRELYRPHTEHGGRDGDGRALRYLEWDRHPGPDETTVTTDYVVVTRDAAGESRVYHEQHVLGLFRRADWLRLMDEVGFRADRVTGTEGRDIFVGVRRGSERQRAVPG
jgi:SAM-dependent methyltransferase